MFNKKQLKKSQEDKRTFNYEQDDVKLNFTLRTDVKRELVAFLDLLNEAKVDIEKVIKSFD